VQKRLENAESDILLGDQYVNKLKTIAKQSATIRQGSSAERRT